MARKYKKGTMLFIAMTGAVAIFVVAISCICWWQNEHIKTDARQITDLQTQLTKQPTIEYLSSRGVKVRLVAAKQSPGHMVVAGLIPGNWSFEASFPVQLKDSKEAYIAEQPAHIAGEWMTAEMQPFTVLLQYPASDTGKGTLILRKDNPSGLPANDDSISVPVTY